MRCRVIPGRGVVVALAAMSAVVLLALLVRVTVVSATWVAAVALLALLALTAWDYSASLQAWRRSTAERGDAHAVTRAGLF